MFELLLKTSTIAVEIKKKPVANELLAQLQEPNLTTRANGQPVMDVKVATEKRYLWLKKGKEVKAELILIDPETQKPVPSSEVIEVIEHTKTKWLSPKYEEVESKDVQFFVLDPDGKIAKNEDGSDKQVMPFEPTDTIEIEDQNWVPSTFLEEWKISYVYEIFATSKNGTQKLFEEWEKHEKKDEIGMTTFSHGNGFKQYYAFLVPFQREGKWVWLMCLSDTKKKYEHTEDVPTDAKVPIRAVPTLATLPPIQALIVPPSTKKKKA